MEKNTQYIIIGLLTLILGVGIGYVASGSRGDRTYANNSQNVPSGMHMMEDGSMMGNGNNTTGTMQEMMLSMNAGLQGRTGDTFDQAFLSEMIVHHQGAVAMAQLALTSSKHQEIKDLASSIITAQNKEIAEMKMWQKTWYNQ